METLFALYLVIKSVGVYTEIQILKEFTAHTTIQKVLAND